MEKNIFYFKLFCFHELSICLFKMSRTSSPKGSEASSEDGINPDLKIKVRIDKLSGILSEIFWFLDGYPFPTGDV